MRHDQSGPSSDEKIQRVLNELGLGERFIKQIKTQDQYKQLVAMPSDGVKKAECFSFTPKTGRISLIPLYDIHYGLKGCNEKKLDGFIDLILHTEDMYTFLGGDVCETATKQSPGNGQQDERLHAGEQRRELTNKLRPLADAGKILFGVPGNHEMRGHRFNEDNPMTEICYDLDIPYCGYSALCLIKVNDITYRLVAHHGVGGGTSASGVATSASRPGKIVVADCFITGHTHARHVHDDIKCEIKDDGTVIENRQVYVTGGSLVNYFGMYPEERLLRPSVTGFVLIIFEGKFKHISVMI